MESAIGALILAWFLSLFGFDDIFVKAMHEIFNVNISSATYYFIFFIVGLIVGVVSHITRW